MKKSLLAHGQTNFLAGLAVILPAVISIGIVVWICRNVANLTDTLLIFLPRALTHENKGDGPMFWYWSLVAFLLAVLCICLIGLFARNYFGKQIIKWVDTALLRIPLLNKIYGATKQVNDAFSSSNKTSFRTVVLVEFPRAGAYSIGFITNDHNREVQTKTGENVVCVFVPTTPNPTSGFLLLVPQDKVIKLDMSVAEGIKYVISLGALVPEYSPVPAKSPPGPLVAAAHD